jgi:hypothetical protein
MNKTIENYNNLIDFKAKENDELKQKINDYKK